MDYSKKTRIELIELCKGNKLKGYSTKKKDELIDMLKEYDEAQKPVASTVVIRKKMKRPTVASSIVLPTQSEISKLDVIKENTIKIEKGFEIVKPIIKWVGGKTQIINKVLDKFPKKIGNYYEPFLGGGSVLLGVLSFCKKGAITITGNIFISDINPQLIALYKYIQNNIDEFIEKLQELVDEFNSIDGKEVNRKPTTKDDALTSQESYYYWIRQQFNELNKDTKAKAKAKEVTIDSSVMLLFLNKTCFRGVYREGPKGFNVPFGHYKNPGIIDEMHLRNVSRLLGEFKDKIVWNCYGFQDAFIKIKEGGEEKLNDFIYLDPPYAPETDTSFVGYTADGFDLKLHQELFKLCNKIKNNGTKLLMSNSDVTLVNDAFLEEDGFTIEVIECRRSINSKNPESKTNEVLISC